MKQCVKCGRELLDDDMFCPECGYVVEEPAEEIVVPVVPVETVDEEPISADVSEEEIIAEEPAIVEEEMEQEFVEELIEEPVAEEPKPRASAKTRALGILSIVFSFLPPAGIALALCGLFPSLKEFREKGVLTGIVLSTIGLVCSVIFLIAICTGVSIFFAYNENTVWYNKLWDAISEAHPGVVD